ncbi:MAG: flagellar hook-basal body complex protein [Planctomycetaceae bacterium]
MGLTSALNTSLNGLSLNETMIDVLGNNIANAGTIGFKASDVKFQTQFARTLSIGSAPTATDGGTNPRQIGLGATVAVISHDFTPGSITNSSSPSDVAIQGDGFFILNGPDGQVYSRDGSFLRNSANQLVNNQGSFVQGYGVDANFDLVTTNLTNLTIPIGQLNIAQQTKNVTMTGALFPTGTTATLGSVLNSETLTDSVSSANASGASLLSNLENSGGQNLFTVGQTLTFTPNIGGQSASPQTLSVTAGTTLNDLAAFINNTLGTQNSSTDPTIPNDGGTGGQPGVSIVNGQLKIVGNSGTVNDVELGVGQLTSTDTTTGNSTVVPLAFTKTQSANGQSTTTPFQIYDSLGQPINMRMTAVLQSSASGLTTYRYYISSPDTSQPTVAIASGTFKFDANGNVLGNTNLSFSLQPANTAAASPMQVNIDVSKVSGISTATAGSNLTMSNQDGAAPGTLQSFTIDDSGVINGVFDNGLSRTLGQIVLARFANPNGLVENAGTTFKSGVNSGAPSLLTPGTFGAGTLRAGSLELSNTDVGKSLVDLIVASTNYRGNSRVIASVQQLVDELLTLGR